MIRFVLIVFLGTTAAACGGSRGAGPAAQGAAADEEVIERGGDRSLGETSRATLTIDATTVTASGTVEVPGDSRLQAAFAMVDAITRAELAKAVAVAIVSLESDIQRDDAAPVLESFHSEVTRALLPTAGPMTHSWQRVRRGNEVVLRLWACTRLPRALLLTTVADAMRARGRDPARAGEVMTHLGDTKAQH